MAVGFVPARDNATAADFGRAADENVFAFWWWAGSAIFVGVGASFWWAAVLGAVAMHSAVAWFSCRRHAQRLRQPERRPRKRNHGPFRVAAVTRGADPQDWVYC